MRRNLSIKGKQGFEDLECYQLALEMMTSIHALSKTLPLDEKFDLYAELRCCSNNVTGNIAEAHGRSQGAGSKEFGEKRIAENEMDYDVALLEEESDY